MNLTDAVLNVILNERIEQDRKWGERNHNDYYWLGILVEEVGEVAKSLIEGKLDELETEIVQVAGVCVAWLECIERRRNT